MQPKYDEPVTRTDRAYAMAQEIKTHDDLEHLQKLIAHPCFKLFRDPAKRFEIDENNLGAFHDLFRYFMADESGPLDLNKGLFIFGRVGRGKTQMMRLFETAHRFNIFKEGGRPFRVVPIFELCDKLTGKDWNQVFSEPKRGYLFQSTCFDDLGNEGDDQREIIHYGNKIRPGAHLIERMSQVFHARPAIDWHVTSNYDPREKPDGELNFFDKIYGPRTASRILEMFNIIELQGVDRRREKK